MQTFVTSFIKSPYESAAVASFLGERMQTVVNHGAFVYGIAGDKALSSAEVGAVEDELNAMLSDSGYSGRVAIATATQKRATKAKAVEDGK